MGEWVRRFGAAFISTATLWVVFSGIAQWQAVGREAVSPNLLRWAGLTGTIALACFGATLVCLAIQWSQRMEQSDLSKHWHEPNDQR